MKRDSFSLIELLVAVTILAVIIMIMSGIFHSSSVAWDAGLRKAHGNMNARAVLGLMTRELQQAVASTNLKCLIRNGVDSGSPQPSISFHVLDPEESTNRSAVKIVYTAGKGGALVRKEYSLGDSYQAQSWKPKVSVNLVTNVMFLNFTTPDSGNAEYTTNLPSWVGIIIGLRRSDDISMVSSRSAGPDGIISNDDDITGW